MVQIALCIAFDAVAQRATDALPSRTHLSGIACIIACAAVSRIRLHVDARSLTQRFAHWTCAFPLHADFIVATFRIDRSASVFCIALAYRFLFAVIDETCQMVIGGTFFGETYFVNAVTTLPARYLRAVV